VANKYRAEASFQVGKKTYRLRFDWNAAVEFESASGKKLGDSMLELLKLTICATSLRAMLWAGLRQKHPKVTLSRAGELIGRIGRAEAMRLMGVALRYYYPELMGEPPDPQRPAPATSSGGGTERPSTASDPSSSGG
jgi:hypothetical protein